MQDEFDSESPELEIRIAGVNEFDQDFGNEGMTDGRDLPWLQDVDLDENNLSDISRDLWQTIQRDVVILNADGEEVERYSLTENRLEDPDNYATLKHMIVDATTPWHNDSMPFDVNEDGAISPIDALQVINHLNSEGPGELPVSKNLSPFLDTTATAMCLPAMRWLSLTI